MTLLNEDPRIFMFENFLTPEECGYFINLAQPRLNRSKVSLKIKYVIIIIIIIEVFTYFYGIFNRGGAMGDFDSARSSTQAWLTGIEDHDFVTLSVTDRILDITNIRKKNYEAFQVLNYQEGQLYNNHHDVLPESYSLPGGARYATFFFYLSDVEEGGTTYFSNLKLDVQPKQGRAILWYNIFSDTLMIDGRMHHQAQPVIKGEKWALNKWLHVSAFK